MQQVIEVGAGQDEFILISVLQERYMYGTFIPVAKRRKLMLMFFQPANQDNVGHFQEECGCTHPLLGSLENSDSTRVCKLTKDSVSQDDTTCILRS